MIRKAKPGEQDHLTEISFASKKYWDYPSDFFTIWQDELTITADYIRNNNVYVYESDDQISAYYSLKILEKDLHIGEVEFTAGVWLDHMFVQPQSIKKSIGTQLFKHCIFICSTLDMPQNFSSLHILADPNAAGFYLKLGCKYMQEYPSSIAGRTTPYLKYNLTMAET